MKTDNQLIAEFMGDNRSRRLYRTSWDWLMPVVEKIEKLYSVNFPPDFVQRLLSGEKEIIDHQYMDVIALPLATPISEVYDNVVIFIKWYNQQPK